MYLRRIDEIDCASDKKYFICCCGKNCDGFFRESKINYMCRFYWCNICGKLYQRVFNFDSTYTPMSGVVFQICFVIVLLSFQNNSQI